MGRLSKIDKLPPEIREEIGRLRQAGRSIDEILAHLGELGGPAAAIKRSPLGRHVKTLDEAGETLRQSRAIAEALTVKLGDQPESRVQRLNIEMMHGIVFRTLLAQASSPEGEDGEEVTFSAKDMKLLSETLRNVATADKMHVDQALKIEALALQKAASRVDGLAKKEGWSAETARRARAEILGVRLDEPKAVSP